MTATHSAFPSALFKDKTVFITGGGSGINLGIAKTFASLGAGVGICGRSQERLDGAKSELEALGAKVFAQSADVRDFKALESAIDNCSDALGPIQTLVCAAAGNFLCPAEDLSANAFKTVVDIDLLGSFNASRAAFNQLKKTQGNIIFISAGMAHTPYMAQAHVGAAKAGIDNLMRNLALEWGRYGIRSNSIVPGPIEGTEGMRRLAPGDAGKKLARSIPMGRFGRAKEIGNCAAFLASPMASYVTGTILWADGGQNLPGSGLFTHFVMQELQKANTAS